MVVFEPICRCPKQFFKIFTLWVFVTYFKKFEFFQFSTACSACVGILLPHAQHALAFGYCMLSMSRHFFTACSACVAHFLPHAQHVQNFFRACSACLAFCQHKLSMHKYFDSFRRLLCWLSMRKHIFLAQAQHVLTFFQCTLSMRRPFFAHTQRAQTFFSAHSAWVGNFLAHTEHAQKTQNGEFLPQLVENLTLEHLEGHISTFSYFEAKRAKNSAKNQKTYLVILCLRLKFCTHQRVCALNFL